QPRIIPHTVLIDRQGKIAAITYPENVTEQVVEDLLAGRTVSLPTKQYGYEKGLDEKALEQMQQKLDAATIYKTVMRTSESESGWSRFYLQDSPFAGRRFEADGIYPIALLSAAFDTPVNRFIDEAGLPRVGYRVDVIVPEGKEYLLRPTIQQIVLTSLGIIVERETRMMDVRVLKRIDGAPMLEPSRAEKALYTFRGPRLTAIRQPIQRLVEYVGNGSKIPVIDETGLRGEYDFSMEWVMGDKNSFDEALHKLGFELTSDRRAVEALVIKRASRPVSL
ncbi:MAG TPA: TIGR03435 family protein, partial [Blastocatellia bacterium]